MAWVRYDHHRQATKEDYQASRARKWSINGDSQYNPFLFGTDEQIEAIETLCKDQGTLIAESASGHRKTYYLNSGVEVGMCSGETTSFVFVEVTSGEFHGRPISREALRELGVSI